MGFVGGVYRFTRHFPPDQAYCLTNHLRRAAVSVPSNIAEGQGRGAGAEFAHHLRIANGSRQEVETQLFIAARLNYIDSDKLEAILVISGEVGRLLSGLLKSVRP